jgi:Tol biopolymer transport system component
VPDDKRQMVNEAYGATAEKIEVEVREGDWLVFNVANNRLRWDGASYFGAAGVKDGEPPVAFVTDPADGRWSYCDDPGKVPAFIAHRDYLADQAALAPANPWGGGDGEMKGRVPEWSGRPIWGRERTTWLKFVARPGPPPAPRTAARPDQGGEKEEPARPVEAPKGSTPEANAAPAVTLKRRATLNGHPALVYCVAVTPDGRKVVSSSAMHVDANTGRPDPRTVIVWDVADEGKTRVVIPIQQSVMSVAPTPDGKAVVAPVGNGLFAFDTKTGRRTMKLPGPAQTNAISIAVSPDGKLAAGGFTTKEVILWNLRTGKPLRTLRGHTNGVIALAFSPDGKQLASGGQDNSVLLWDVATGRAERTLADKDADSPVTCVVYTPDGSRLASVNSGDNPRFWDPKMGGLIQTLGGGEILSYRSASISPDGRRIATASLDPSRMKWAVVLWDAATGRRLATAEDGDGQVNAVVFTPDGHALASGGGNTVKIWDITSTP